MWGGDPLKAIEGGPVSLSLSDAFYLYWMAGLTADSPPSFELWVTTSTAWNPPDATPDFGVVKKGESTTAIRPAPDAGGWHVWWTAGTIEARRWAPYPTGPRSSWPWRRNQTSSRTPKTRILRLGARSTAARCPGDVDRDHASPSVSRETLQDALSFVRDLVEHQRIRVRGDAEREAFEGAALIYAPDKGLLHWDGDAVSVADDERTLLSLAGPVFRARHGGQWPSDEVDYRT